MTSKAHRKYSIIYIFTTDFNVTFFVVSLLISRQWFSWRNFQEPGYFFCNVIAAPRLNEDIENRVTGSQSFLCSTRSGSAANYRCVADNLLNKFMPGVLTFWNPLIMVTVPSSVLSWYSRFPFIFGYGFAGV